MDSLPRHLSGPVNAVIERSGLKSFNIQNFSLAVILGDGDLAVRLSGATAVFPGSYMQVILGRQAGSPFGGTLAFSLRGDMFTSLLQKLIPGFSVPGLNFVAAGSTLSMMISSREIQIANTPLALDPPLDFIGGIKRGFEMNLRMGLPPDCAGQQFCEVAKKLLGANAALQISTVINPPDVTLSASVTDLQITSGLILKSVTFAASFPKLTLQFAGTIQINADKSGPPLELTATVGIKGASVMLGASMTGMWRRAFGIERLAIGNIIVELGITATLGAPSILIGGEVVIGKNCPFPVPEKSHCISGAVYVSINPADPTSNWFAGEMTNMDFRRLITAFTDIKNLDAIPAPILNSGFPGKSVISLCPLGGCAVMGREYPKGFQLKGTLNILDVTAKVDILIDMGVGMKVSVELSPITLANGLIKAWYSKDDRTKGPHFKLDVTYAEMTGAVIKLNCYVKVLVFETQAMIDISPMDYALAFTAQYFAFTATFSFKASIGARLRGFSAGALPWLASSHLIFLCIRVQARRLF